MDEAERALRYLRDGCSVDLVGRPGSGRSAIVGRVRAALADAGHHVIGVHGVRAQRERAQGVLMSGGRDARSGKPTLVRDPAALLEREIRPGTVVLVDDADDLDPVTAGAVGAVHVASRVPVLAARRPLPPRSAAAHALVAGLRPAVRLPVTALRFPEVQRMVRELLGADVDPLTVARVATKSGGLPALIEQLVLVGRETGALQRFDGTWAATRGLWSPGLAHVVEALLADVDHADVRLLAMVADAGTVTLATAVPAVDPERVASLRRGGLLEVVPGADGLQVSLFPPLLADFLVHEHPVLHPSGPAPAADDPVLSRVLAHHWAREEAVRRARWAAHPVPATAVPLLEAVLNAGNPLDEVSEVYRRTDLRDADASGHAELVSWYAVSLTAAEGDPDAATRVLRDARGMQAATSTYLGAVEDHLRLFYDRVPSPAGAPAGDARLPGPAGEARTGVAVEAALAGGRVADAERLLAGARPAHPVFRRHREVTAGLAAVLAGRLEEGVAQALEHLAAARLERDPGALVAHSYVAGLGLAAAGRLAELDDVLSAVLTLTSVPVLHEHYRTGTLGLAAFSARWQGSAIPRLLARPGEPHRRPGPYPAMQTRDTLVSGDRTAVLHTAVRDRLERGYVAAGIVAAVEGAERFGLLAGDLDLRAYARDVDAPLLDALVRYAEALTERDAAQLAESSHAFEALGAHLYAVRAHIARALRLRADGDSTTALAEVEAAWTLSRGFGTPVTGLFAPVVEAVDLSGRELHVVELHAAGLSTGDIATALTLSPRTVESHFSSAYRKLGLDSRDGLSRATSTWLAPALRQVPPA